jgi:hypothetical protein
MRQLVATMTHFEYFPAKYAFLARIGWPNPVKQW